MTTKGMEFMTKKKIKLLPHAPYSPDLAQCDFWLFPQLKTFLAKSKFDTKMELKAAVEGYMKEVSKNGLLFVMESWDKRLTKCIELQGDYVKKYLLTITFQKCLIKKILQQSGSCVIYPRRIKSEVMRLPC